jgi:hypothetical protein
MNSIQMTIKKECASWEAVGQVMTDTASSVSVTKIDAVIVTVQGGPFGNGI